MEKFRVFLRVCVGVRVCVCVEGREGIRYNLKGFIRVSFLRKIFVR